MELNPHLVSNSALRDCLLRSVWQDKPISRIEAILAGDVPEFSGLLLLPPFMLETVKRLRGEQHTLDHTLFLAGKLFVRFRPPMSELLPYDANLPLLCYPHDITNEVLEHFTGIVESSKALWGKPTGVMCLSVLPYGMFLVPGWKYRHNDRGDVYELIALTNIARDPKRSAEFPYAIVYRDEAGSIWSSTLSEFCRRFTTVEEAQPAVTRLETVYASEVSVTPIQGNLYFEWNMDAVGFGQLSLTSNPEGGFFIQNELMGRRFIKSVLCNLVDNAKLEDE